MNIFQWVLKGFVEALPAALARALLLGTLVAAGALHFFAIHRIEVLEVTQARQEERYQATITVVTELRDEVRGYRADILEQNRLLREATAKHGKKAKSMDDATALPTPHTVVASTKG